MPSLVSCLLAGLAVADRAAAASYSLSKTYDASNFLNEFHFWETGTIPTQQDNNGAWVKYLNVKDAVDEGLASVKDNKVYLGVDSMTKLENKEAGPRRAALRVQSKESFREGLIITKFYRMPEPACGVWMTYGLQGEDWPLGGEIDMYKGWNLQTANTPAIHVGPKRTVGQCYLDKSAQSTIISDDCDNEFQNNINAWKGQGCQVEEAEDYKGGIWASISGGTQALEWTNDTIKLYSWDMGNEPENIDSKNPDTSSWGKPSVQLTSPGCDTSKAFRNQTILFTLSFCDNPGNEQFWKELPADGKSGETCKQITGMETCVEYVAANPKDFSYSYFGINYVRIFVQDAEKSDDDNNANSKGQLSLDGSSPSLTFTYATSQSSSGNWIGIWPEDDTQAPIGGSTTWDYTKGSSGSLQLTPPSSMKAGKYKAYLLSSDRTILAFLSSFDYKLESSGSSVAFSVKTHYNINCGGSVNNNIDIKPGNGVCVRTNCDVGSLEISSVGSCPDGQVRISYWQNADCGGDWYGYGYGSRGTCRGLWSSGWGFKSLWVSCADPASDCIQQGTCTAAPEPATEVCRAATKPDAGATTDAAFHLKTRYSAGCTGNVHNEVIVRHGNGQCINTNCAVGSLDIDSVGNCPDGELRISYWDQPGCSGKWFGYGYGSRNTCRSLWSGGWSFKSLWVSCAKPSDDCISRGTCTIDDPSGSNVC